LAFWLDVGIVGLTIFFSAFFYTFYKMQQLSHHALPALYSMLILSMYEPWLTSSLNSYTIQFVFIGTIILYCKKNDIQNKIVQKVNEANLKSNNGSNLGLLH
jgi:hypothetical protein